MPVIRLHATRHTLADTMLGAGMPAMDVAARLGHTTEVLHDRYGRATAVGALAVGERIGALYAV